MRRLSLAPRRHTHRHPLLAALRTCADCVARGYTKGHGKLGGGGDTDKNKRKSAPAPLLVDSEDDEDDFQSPKAAAPKRSRQTRTATPKPAPRRSTTTDIVPEELSQEDLHHMGIVVHRGVTSANIPHGLRLSAAVVQMVLKELTRRCPHRDPGKEASVTLTLPDLHPSPSHPPHRWTFSQEHLGELGMSHVIQQLVAAVADVELHVRFTGAPVPLCFGIDALGIGGINTYAQVPV